MAINLIDNVNREYSQLAHNMLHYRASQNVTSGLARQPCSCAVLQISVVCNL